MTNQPVTPLYCYNHPTRETMLRCNRCDRPICTECAVLTPTGYRCKECVRGQQKVFETAQSVDYVIAGTISLILALIGSFLATAVGFLTIFVAPIIGIIIAEAVRWAVRRRRSKLLFQVALWAAVAGCVPALAIRLFGLLAFGGTNLFALLPLVWQGLYTFMVASTIYYRLSGIHIG